MHSKALLVTYQSEKMHFRCEGLSDLDDKQLVAALQQVPSVAKFMDWLPKTIEEVANAHAIDEYSWSLEICLKTYKENYNDTKSIRLHIHATFERDLARFKIRSLSRALAIASLTPSHIAGCSDPTSGKKSKGTAAMHYYNQMPKRGKVTGGTNHPAYEAFLVNPRWIAGCVQRQKMSSEEAKQDFCFCIYF